MNFRREPIRDFLQHDTQVENFFIAEYLPDADGLAIKVYLTALMYAGRAEISNELIARQLGVDVEDVLQAWNYWENVGVIRKHYLDITDRFHYTVEFLSLRERVYSMGGPRNPVDRQEPDSMQTIRDELDEDGLREVFDTVQEITGRMLEGREPEKIVSWINDDGVEPALVCRVYRYCADRDKTGFSYINTVMENWIREDIRTLKEAEQHLSENDERYNRYRRVMKALGFSRNATEEEQRKIDSWFEELGFGMDKVLEACGRTSGISNPNINYVNSILTSWAKGQLKTAGPSGSVVARGSSKSMAAKVKQVYEEIRNRHAAELKAHREDAFARAPRLREIEEEESSSVRKLSKLALSGGNFGGLTSADLRERMDSLNREKIGILTELGLPANYLEQTYDCSKCKDTGILDDGNRCSCYGEKLRRFV